MKIPFSLKPHERAFLDTKKWYWFYRAAFWCVTIFIWFSLLGILAFGTGGNVDFLGIIFLTLVTTTLALIPLFIFYLLLYGPIRSYLIKRLYDVIPLNSGGKPISRGKKTLITIVIVIGAFFLYNLISSFYYTIEWWVNYFFSNNMY